MIKNKIIKKAFKLFLAFSLLLGILLQNSSLSVVKAEEANRVNTKITRFEIKNTDGSAVPPGQEYGYWNQFRLDMDWDASSYGNKLKEGDYFIVTLPDKFKYPTDGPTVDFPLYTPDGKTVIANAHVNSNGENGGGTVKVTFTKYVENKENVKGNLYLQARFAFDKIKEGENNVIIVSIGGVPTSVDIKIGKKPIIENETFAKWGEKVPGKEDEAKWVLRVNHKKGNYKNVTISDKLYVNTGSLPPEIHYIVNSFVIHKVEYNEFGNTTRVVSTHNYDELKDFLHFFDNNTRFIFDLSKKFGDINGKQYLFEYRSTYTPQLMLRNEGVFHSTEKDEISRAWFKNSEAGGGGQGDLTQKIKIFKIDEKNNKIKLPDAEFLVTKIADGSTFTLKTNAQGEAVSDKLDPGVYKIKETKAPKGYELDETEREITVVEGEALFWTATNAKIKASVELGAKKTLEGKALEANKYSFTLKKENGEIIETVENAANGDVKFKALTYDQEGTYKYKISEVQGNEQGITYDQTEHEVVVTVTTDNATNKLKAEVSKQPDQVKFTNRYTPAADVSVELGAKKTLEGKALEAEKYSFTLKKENGEVIETVKNAANGDVKFKALTYTEAQIGKHKYKISEVKGSETGITYDETEYEVEVTITKDNATNKLKVEVSKQPDQVKFTNIYTPAKTEISVTKAWKDADNQDGKRPESIIVKLLADGNETNKTVELNAGNNWTAKFTNLDADKGGVPIKYTIAEVNVPARYTSVISGEAKTGLTITNSYTPEVINVSGTKTWDDANNQDGKRPDKIKVILNKTVDGQTTKVTEKEVTKDNWNYEFNDLPKYENGKEITYSIDEEAVPGYEKEVTGYNLKNSHTPEVVNV
ncbi:Cna B-type domain-containing protein, partial [Gemella haemolysans]